MPTAQQSDYSATVLDIALDAIKSSTYGDRFQKFFYGNPEEEIGLMDCPCVIGVKERTVVTHDATGMDKIVFTLVFRIIINAYKISQSASPTNDVMTFRELENMIEGVDPTTNLYDTTSIVGIIRTNFTLNNYSVNQEMQIEYGGSRDIFLDQQTREAQIKLTVDRLQLVPNRT